MSTNQTNQVIILLMDQSATESDQVLFINIARNHHHYCDQDLCFYNFSCLRPVQGFLPFNAVFSNITYIGAGLLSRLSTHVRTHLRPPLPHLRLAEELEEAQGSQGVSTVGGHTWVISTWVKCASCDDLSCRVPAQSGIFQALGLCLILEGVMSAVAAPLHLMFRMKCLTDHISSL